MSARRHFLAILLALPVLAVARPARAYLCTPADRNASQIISLIWKSRCIPYAISRNGTLLAGEARRQLVAQSFRVWTQSACTDMEFLDVGYTSQLSSFDPMEPDSQINAVASIEDQNQLGVFDDPRLLAVTLTRYSRVTGEIFDADIMFNAVGFKFDDVADQTACEAGTRPYDLRNTLIHEIGHLLGFDHETDPGSTMFANAPPCETKKRTIETGDVNGLCDLYPAGRDGQTCAPPSGGYEPSGADPTPYRNQCDRFRGGEQGGCSCRDAGSRGSAVAMLPLLAAVLLRRGRRAGPSGR